MSTGWNQNISANDVAEIINLLGNEYWLELVRVVAQTLQNYKPTGK